MDVAFIDTIRSVYVGKIVVNESSMNYDAALTA
jgi:hypothetical protein